MPNELDKDYYAWKYIPQNMGYRLFEKTDDDCASDGMVKNKYGDDDSQWEWVYPEKHFLDENNLCPICKQNELESTRKGQKYKSTCSNPICRETYRYFSFEIEIKDFGVIPKGYAFNMWIEDSDGRKRSDSQFSRSYTWKYWEHREEINKVRAEVAAGMYLEGLIRLTEEALPYLDKNFCKPIKYKQSIKRFSYETHKSNSDTLRNYGWSDLLLSGVTPTRSKSSKHAKHH